jgi:hypothetical protein
MAMSALSRIATSAGPFGLAQRAAHLPANGPRICFRRFNVAGSDEFLRQSECEKREVS